MDILFILLGLAIFFAAAAVFAIDHFGRNPAQAIVSFFVPPFAWWLYAHYKRESRRIVYSQLVAFALILGGVVMNQWFASGQTIQVFENVSKQTPIVENYVGSNKAFEDLARAERKSKQLNGRLYGYDLVFSSEQHVAEFDRHGVFRIKSKQDFHGEVELAIEFNHIPEPAKEPWVKTIRPDTVNAPVIYVSWLDENSKTLKSVKYDSAYSLDFRLEHQEYNLYLAFMQLVLPDPHNSYLVGKFPVYSSRLRFHGEGLIKTHDSIETLELIATQTLLTTYRKMVEQVLGFQYSNYDYRSGSGLGRSVVFVQDKQGRIRKVNLLFYKNDSGWFLDIKGLEEALKDDALVVMAVPEGLKPAYLVDQRRIGYTKLASEGDAVDLEAINEQLLQEAAARQAASQQAPESVENNGGAFAESPSSLSIDLATQEAEIESLLAVWMNQDVELQTVEGKFKEGVYVGIYRKQVVLEKQLGGGSVELLTEYRDIKSMHLTKSPRLRPQTVEFLHPVPK